MVEYSNRRLGVRIISATRDFDNFRVVLNKKNSIQKFDICSLFTEERRNRAFYYCSALCSFIFSKIIFHPFVRGSSRIDPFLRKEIKWENQHKCQICLEQMKKNKLNLHHVCSKAAGGLSIKENLIPLCIEHHSRLHELVILVEKWMISNINYFTNIYDLLLSALDIMKYYINNFFDNKPYKKIFQANEFGLL